MIFRNILIGFILIASSFVSATVPASRKAREHFTQARMRHSSNAVMDVKVQSHSAWGAAQKFEKLDFSKFQATDFKLFDDLTQIPNINITAKRSGSVAERTVSDCHNYDFRWS